jgi:hypothetical protein
MLARLFEFPPAQPAPSPSRTGPADSVPHAPTRHSIKEPYTCIVVASLLAAQFFKNTGWTERQT